jgi:DNA-binding transcriptional ArsR family regulator
MVTDDEMIEAVRSVGQEKFAVTAQDLTDHVDLTRQSIGNRLRKLADEGRVRRRKVGGNAVVYYLPEWERALSDLMDRTELSF